MKKVASLLAITALIACSESENVADANDDDIVAQEESSSSSLVSIDSIIIPELGSVCGSPSLVTQKKNDP